VRERERERERDTLIGREKLAGRSRYVGALSVNSVEFFLKRERD
jgi:hypothetical protein